MSVSKRKQLFSIQTIIVTDIARQVWTINRKRTFFQAKEKKRSTFWDLEATVEDKI